MDLEDPTGAADPFAGLAAANAAAAAWCAEVNGTVHSEICAVPTEQLVIERELLAPLPSPSHHLLPGSTGPKETNSMPSSWIRLRSPCRCA